MLPKGEIVPKECGFNLSETACGLCAGIASRFPCLPATARDGELIKMQHSCHHVDTIRHPNSSYVTTKLYGTSTCGCNNNAIFSESTIFTFPTVDVCRARCPGSGETLVIHAKVERWQHYWIHYFSFSRFPFCVSTVSNIMIILQWCSAYCLNCSLNIIYIHILNWTGIIIFFAELFLHKIHTLAS